MGAIVVSGGHSERYDHMEGDIQQYMSEPSLAIFKADQKEGQNDQGEIMENTLCEHPFRS